LLHGACFRYGGLGFVAVRFLKHLRSNLI
jgi:hypothetical protein